MDIVASARSISVLADQFDEQTAERNVLQFRDAAVQDVEIDIKPFRDLRQERLSGACSKEVDFIDMMSGIPLIDDLLNRRRNLILHDGADEVFCRRRLRIREDVEHGTRFDQLARPR